MVRVVSYLVNHGPEHCLGVTPHVLESGRVPFYTDFIRKGFYKQALETNFIGSLPPLTHTVCVKLVWDHQVSMGM